MTIIHPIIRPPAEADSILIQLTTGCSSNSCDFCAAYRNKRFGLKPLDEIHADIAALSHQYPFARRIFLMDGDALILSNHKLLPILEMIQFFFPRLTRISSYANGFNLTARTDQELSLLFQHKLRLVYIGLESGSNEILAFHNKRSTADEMTMAVQRAKLAGIKSSVIVLLGLGGKQHSAHHVQETVKALNAMQPHYLSFLSLMIVPGTPLAKKLADGVFQELGPHELLQEAQEILNGLHLSRTLFRMNHASNHLPLEGTLSKDKDYLLSILKQGINGDVMLKPESFRGL